ncbi:MAG TPA: peptidylprolyl isomerase [Clostridiales bacterium]|nr:peptidylprolyl isomerase [Clostridiales bacterium]
MNKNKNESQITVDKKPGKEPGKKISLYVLLGFSVLIVLVAAIAGFSSYSRTYVASVGNMKISIPEYRFVLNQEKANMLKIAGNPDPATFWDTVIADGEKAIDIAKRKSLENLRDLKIQVSKAKEQKIVLDKTDLDNVNQFTQSIIAQNNNNKSAANSFTMEVYGVNLKEFEEIYKQYILRSKFVQNEMKSIDAKEEEIETYYDKFPDAFKDASYRENGQEAVWAKHILVLTIDTETQKEFTGAKLEAATKKAEELLQRAKGGEDFAKLARENSEDTGSAETGGDYVFGKGYMDPEFEKTGFELEPGQISGLVKSSYGYHIIKLEEKIPQGEPVSLRCAKEYMEFKENAVRIAKYMEKLEEWKKDSKYKVSRNNKVYDTIE